MPEYERTNKTSMILTNNSRMSNETPYSRLAAAVIRQAYSDYAEAYAFLRARKIEEEQKEGIEREKAETILNRRRGCIRRAAMKEANRRGKICLEGYTDLEEYVEVRLYAEESYARHAIKEVTSFCRSERFGTFAQKIDGEWLIKQIRQNVEAYFEGRRKTYRLMFTRESIVEDDAEEAEEAV